MENEKLLAYIYICVQYFVCDRRYHQKCAMIDLIGDFLNWLHENEKKEEREEYVVLFELPKGKFKSFLILHSIKIFNLMNHI